MKPKNLSIAVASVVLSLSLAGAGCAAVTAFDTALAPELEALARAALQGEAPQAGAAIERLRQAGPAGMAAALALLDSGESTGGTALDRVCGVADCAAIRLFWYRDLDEAKAAAQAQGKPILSLRLLGRLDEELSCANSRFFRTALYPNRAIGELLREQFVLHWHSVRPVPKVTIDFGDGRTLQQTVTGNSLHYLLDSRGRLLDVLPGLYGPETFERELRAAREATASTIHLDDEGFSLLASRRHTTTLRKLDAKLARDAATLGPRAPSPGALTRRIYLRGSDTAAKSSSEAPLATAIDLEVPDQALDRLAARRRAGVRLDEASRAFLLRKQGVTDEQAGARLIASFEADLALDEVINEVRYRRPILAGLAAGDLIQWVGSDLEVLTSLIYEGVFEDPISDPWMGLARREVYAALPMPPAPPRLREPALPK